MAWTCFFLLSTSVDSGNNGRSNQRKILKGGKKNSWFDSTELVGQHRGMTSYNALTQQKDNFYGPQIRKRKLPRSIHVSFGSKSPSENSWQALYHCRGSTFLLCSIWEFRLQWTDTQWPAKGIPQQQLGQLWKPLCACRHKTPLRHQEISG